MHLFLLSAVLATIINVPAGADLQAKLNAARPGDELVLQAGATYSGPFTLGPKEGTGEIVIRSSAVLQLPEGNRAGPAQAALMPKLVSNSDAVIQILPGAHDYRLIGLEIGPAPGRFLNDVVRIGSGAERTLAEQPRNISVERSYLHGDPQVGTRRGVAMNGVNNTVADSYFENFKAVDVEAQAIAGWNGAGPYVIRNNHLEASAENIIFGGGDPAIDGLIPTNIRIEKNELRKPTSWKGSTPHWMVKNLLELKNARQVVIDNNVLEDTWPDAQAGYAVVFTPRNQDGHSPWSTVEDVQFTNNVVRRAAHGMLILGHDSPNPSGRTQRISIRNNVFEVTGALFEFIDGPRDVDIEFNTGLSAAMAISASGEKSSGLVYRNNVTVRDEGGILGFPSALASYFPDAVVVSNTFVGGMAANYPANNFFSVQPIAEVEQPGIHVGYAVVTPDAGTAAPLGSALVGRLQNAQVLSQTTVFAPALTTSAAMFVDVVPAIGRNMGLAVANPQAIPVSVTLQLVDAGGTTMGVPKVVTLPPYAQVARFVNELFDTMPAAFAGTLSLTSSAPVASMGFRFAGANFSVISIDSASTTSPMPARAGSIGGAAAAMFPQFAIGEGWASQIMLLNRSAAASSGRVDLFDTDGNPLKATLNGVSSATFRYSIPAGGMFLLAPRDVNGQTPF